MNTNSELTTDARIEAWIDQACAAIADRGMTTDDPILNLLALAERKTSVRHLRPPLAGCTPRQAEVLELLDRAIAVDVEEIMGTIEAERGRSWARTP